MQRMEFRLVRGLSSDLAVILRGFDELKRNDVAPCECCLERIVVTPYIKATNVSGIRLSETPPTENI